jgi:hypothetical protein
MIKQESLMRFKLKQFKLLSQEINHLILILIRYKMIMISIQKFKKLVQFRIFYPLKMEKFPIYNPLTKG